MKKKDTSPSNKSEIPTQPQSLDRLRQKVKDFPQTPGVYLMKNQGDKIIYVGKAKSLRHRVRSYLGESADLTPKTKLLVKNIFEIEFILTKTEVEAFLLEASLIKKFRPKYNIRLKDDKSYPYIRLSISDKYPRLYLSRKVKKDGSRYFGPFASSFSVNETIRFLNRTFKIRDCTDFVMKTRRRPCMTYQIGRCTAPCVDYITEAIYKEDVKGAQDFLDGKSKNLITRLKERMQDASQKEQFEVAARFRDSLKAIQAILEKQTVIKNSSFELDQDLIGFYTHDSDVVVETMHIRAGRNIGTRAHFLPDGFSGGFDDFGNEPSSSFDDSYAIKEGLISFLNQYYDDNFIPDEVLLPIDLGRDLSRLLEAVLEERAGKKIKVRYPTDEEHRTLMEKTNQLAQEHLIKLKAKSQQKILGLDEIQAKLNLPERPNRIECYDISHFQGQQTVASQVVFEDGVPNSDEYRRYQLKEDHQNNDYSSMKEVLSRRLQHKEWDLPQLIVIDGGKGQLNVAVQILQELGHPEIPLVGLAKARAKGDFTQTEVAHTEERFFLPNRANPVVFKPNTEAFQILVGLRDEAHRFAITYHRKLREGYSLESELDMVIGLGEKRKRDLLKHFSSVEALRAASVEDILAVPGFHRVLAERILLQLSEEGLSTDEAEENRDE